MVARESQLVELVDADGAATGPCAVAEAHTAPGRLHRAFSVMLLDDLGRVLIQQRAAVKTRFALRWANACCGHPAPGQAARAAAHRLVEEIGSGGRAARGRGVPVPGRGTRNRPGRAPSTTTSSSAGCRWTNVCGWTRPRSPTCAG